MKSSVAKVVLAFRQLQTDAFLLGDVAIQPLYVTLSLFSAFAFGFSSRTFSFRAVTLGMLGQGGGGLNFVQVFVVGEVDDNNDRRAHEQNCQAYLVN